jgi:hypothetical protein
MGGADIFEKESFTGNIQRATQLPAIGNHPQGIKDILYYSLS